MQIILPILLVLSAYYFSKFIRINSVFLYLIAVILSSASMLYTSDIFLLITTGILGLSFLIVIMYTGIFKTGSKIKRQLSSVRKDYAILGFIFITPYAYSNITDSISYIIPIQYFAIAFYIFMIPLFITSFRLIRSKMKTSSWIKLHKLAYVAYLFLFLHLITVSSYRYILFYYLLFGLYAILKLNQRFTSHSFIKATTITFLMGSGSLIFINNIVDELDEPTNIIENSNFEDGTYIGYSRGYQNIDTIVRVSIRNNQIEYVILEECGCTQNVNNGYYSDIAHLIANDIRIENRTNIDSIAGATKTSVAVNKAVINALQGAIIEK